MPTKRPFEEFLPALLSHPLIAERAHQQFGPDADAFLHAANAADSPELFDLIHDTAHNEAQEVARLNAQGDDGTFPISIYQFGPVFWASAPDFDHLGYFANEEDAVAAARLRWDVFLDIPDFLTDG